MNTVNKRIKKNLNREERHFIIRHSYLEIELIVSDNVGVVFANDAKIRLVNYSMMAWLS